MLKRLTLTRLRPALLGAALLLISGPLISGVASAAPVTFPGPVIVDDAGNRVTPASLTVASVTDLDGTAVSSPGAVAHFAGSNASVVYDVAAHGEAWVTLTPVLTGHTFTTNPPVVFCSADPGSLAGTNTRVTTALPGVAPGASGGLPTVGTGSGQVNPSGGTYQGVTLATGQNVATVGGLAPPANWNLLAINSLGLVRLDLTQPLDTTNTGDTLGGSLLAARAQGFGKWVIAGTPGQAGATLKLYAADATTLLRTFDLSTAGSRL